MKKLLIPLLAVMLCGSVWSAGPVNHLDSLDFPIVATGDTAQVSKITPTLAIMGFEYKDSISYWNPADSTDTTAHSQISWTSPMQAMILTIGPITATPTLIDTTILLTVGCTVVFAGTAELGIEYDTETGADDLLATAIDSIVDIFNKATNLSDSVVAQDSGTYIKLVSLIGEGTQEGPWTMQLSLDSLDTAGAPDSVTIAMICDSMVATANASDTIPTYMTAFDSATFYIIQSDDAGLLFFYTFYNHADTHGTLAASQANVTSSSRFGDTINLISGAGATTSPIDWAGLQGTITIQASPTTSQGIGLDDSVYMFLSAWTSVAGSKVYSLIDSDSCEGFPCALRFMHAATTAGTDTLFKDGTVFHYEITDSATGVPTVIKYPIYWDFKITER